MPAKPNTFLEEVETQIIMGRVCTIRFRNQHGGISSLNSTITKLYEEDSMQYILIDNTLRLPVNNLVEVNGVSPDKLG